MLGGSGNDRLYEGDGGGVVNGGPGNDVVIAGCVFGCPQAGQPPDTVLGGDCNDVVGAQNGKRDTLDGGPGDDVCWADRDLDTLRACEETR